MNGTEWTEPGQGAKAEQLTAALAAIPHGSAGSISIALVHCDDLRVRRGRLQRTNLRLTGAALTAADVARIEAAK